MFSILLSFAMATADTQTEYGRNGRWLINKKEHGCEMMTGRYSQRGGKPTILHIAVDDRISTVTMTFSEPTTKSLKEGEKRSIEVRFLRANSLNKEWGSSEFVVTGTGEDGTFFAKRFTSELLDDIGESRGILFYYEDTILQAYPLEESANAIVKLRQCAAEVARDNPSDPFAQ